MIKQIFIIFMIFIVIINSAELRSQEKTGDGMVSAGEVKKTAEEDFDLYILPAGGFHDSMFRINFIYGGYIVNPWGEMTNREERLYDKYKAVLPPGPLFQENEMTYSWRNTGFSIDYMFQSIKYCQRLKFDLTGIKFGMRAGYSYSRVNQYIYLYPDDDSGDLLYKSSGKIMDYKTLQAGPTVDFIFSTRTNRFNVLVHGYMLLGYISDGHLTAAPALRDADIAFDSARYSASFNGCSVSFGFGPHFVLNRWVPVTIGVNLKYTHSMLFMDNPVPVYGDDDVITFNSLGAEIVCGIHFL